MWNLINNYHKTKSMICQTCIFHVPNFYLWFHSLNRTLYRNAALPKVSLANQHIDQHTGALPGVIHGLLQNLLHLSLIGAVQAHALAPDAFH